jgi:hypothetical protein
VPLAPKRAHTATMQSMRRRGGPSHGTFDPVPLSLLSQHHFTALPSPERYDSRYEQTSKQILFGSDQDQTIATEDEKAAQPRIFGQYVAAVEDEGLHFPRGFYE